MKGKTKVIISDELIEKVLDDMEKAQETVDEDWDEESRKDWEEKIKSRLFDIIQHDLRTRYNESFRIHDCIVAADYNITYSMKFAFPFLWNMYGKDLKYKKFRRQVSVSHRYG